MEEGEWLDEGVGAECQSDPRGGCRRGPEVVAGWWGGWWVWCGLRGVGVLYSSDGAFNRVCSGAHWVCVGFGEYFLDWWLGLAEP